MRTEEMRKLIKSGTAALIVLTVFLAIVAISALKDWRKHDPIYNSISVNGEGEVHVVPDVATFTFDVAADAATPEAAQNLVTPKIDAIVAALKDLGIEEKDIDTSNYTLNPKTHYVPVACTATFCPPGRQVTDGYTTTHTITVKVRNIADSGKALAALTGRGATNISGISFTTDDPAAAQNEARAKAIANAKETAESLADELGVDLVRVIGFYDNREGGYPVPIYAGSKSAMDSAVVASAPSLPVGENTVRSSVSITYEIR